MQTRWMSRKEKGKMLAEKKWQISELAHRTKNEGGKETNKE